MLCMHIYEGKWIIVCSVCSSFMKTRAGITSLLNIVPLLFGALCPSPQSSLCPKNKMLWAGKQAKNALFSSVAGPWWTDSILRLKWTTLRLLRIAGFSLSNTSSHCCEYFSLLKPSLDNVVVVDLMSPKKL